MTTARARAIERPISLLLIVIAIVLFILAALGVPDVKGVAIGWFGLAFFAGSFVF